MRAGRVGSGHTSTCVTACWGQLVTLDSWGVWAVWLHWTQLDPWEPVVETPPVTRGECEDHRVVVSGTHQPALCPGPAHPQGGV